MAYVQHTNIQLVSELSPPSQGAQSHSLESSSSPFAPYLSLSCTHNDIRNALQSDGNSVHDACSDYGAHHQHEHQEHNGEGDGGEGIEAE